MEDCDKKIQDLKRLLENLQNDFDVVQEVLSTSISHKATQDKRTSELEFKVKQLECQINNFLSDPSSKMYEMAQIKEELNDSKSDTQTSEVNHLLKGLDLRSNSLNNLIKGFTLMVKKGVNLTNINLNDWLKTKLEKTKVDWTVTHSNSAKWFKVEFASEKDKDFIWYNRKAWALEKMWYWGEYITPDNAKQRSRLMEFGREQECLGKNVTITSELIYVNGEKYVYCNKLDEILKHKVVELLEKRFND